MTFNKNTRAKFAILLLILVSLVFRVISIPHTNYDMTAHNVPWYMILYNNGITTALGTEFADYTPPYTYLLALATFTYGFIPPLTAIKIIPMCFDVLGAFLIYKIVKLKFRQGYQPALAAAIYFTLPTVILNSANWGQADSIYTAFLLACLYFFMTGKTFTSLLSLGVAFSIKAQSTFFLPFLVIMALRKKVPWLYFGMLPLVYLLAIMPVVIFGRPFLEALLIYKDQSFAYSRLSMLSPNAYILIPNDWYSWLTPVGLIATVVLLALWIRGTAKSKITFEHRHIVLIAFLSAALTPFLLPKMHDRYFYPADVLSVVLAFYWPGLWFLPILYQLASTSAISVFLFDTNMSYVVFGFLFNTFALMAALRTQRLAENRGVFNPRISSTLSWLITILTPLILFGVGMDLLLTPAFIRVQYIIPQVPTDQRGLDKSERFRWASEAMDYLTNSKKTQYLNRLELENGSPVFNAREIAILDDAKQLAQKLFKYWHLSLAATFILGLLAWVGDWLSKFRHAIRRGGWLALGITGLLAMGFFIFLKGFNPGIYFQDTDILPRLFPVNFWRISFLFVVLGLGGGGFLLTRISSKPQV